MPVSPLNRYGVLDALRGFALLGILLANSAYFSMYVMQEPKILERFPTAAADKWLTNFHLALIDGKFYSIFSLLFGIGFSLILFGNSHDGNKLLLFYRRLFFLLLIGLAHVFLIWDGDILMFYALVGTLLPLFRHLKPKTLFIIAVILILSPLLFDWIKVLTDNSLNLSNPIRDISMELDKDLGIGLDEFDDFVVVNSAYSDLLTWNRSGFVYSWYLRIDSNRIPKVLAMFIIGLAVGKIKLYSRINEFRPILKRIMIWCFCIGLPAGIAKVYFENDHVILPDPRGLLDTLAYALNVVPLALAYSIVFALIYDRFAAGALFNGLRSAGRMALTNYIAQAIISLTIYYGIGFGLATSVGPTYFIPIAILIFTFQMLYSTFWFRFFHFGPLEWIWRQLTYWRRLPILKG